MEKEPDTKKLYKAVKQQLGWNGAGPPQSLVVNGARISAPKPLANAMVNYYSEKINKLMESLPRNRGSPFEVLEAALERWVAHKLRQPLFELVKTNESEILEILKNMGDSSAFGHNFIDAKTMKLAPEILAKPISHLVNISIESSDFSNRWKKARVIPLFKGKGADRNNPSGYRPVSLLPTTAKVTEHVVQMQVQKFLETTKQINNNLHAYRNNLNTTTTLLQMSDAIMRSTDRNYISTLITIDESAAFDCVGYNILMKKLELYNIGPRTINWFKNYLNRRQHFVAIGAKCSETINVYRGAPQGSVLGPPAVYNIRK